MLSIQLLNAIYVCVLEMDANNMRRNTTSRGCAHVCATLNRNMLHYCKRQMKLGNILITSSIYTHGHKIKLYNLNKTLYVGL